MPTYTNDDGTLQQTYSVGAPSNRVTLSSVGPSSPTTIVMPGGSSGTYTLALTSWNNVFTASQTFQMVDAGTTNVALPATIRHDSSGTPAAGFGVGLSFTMSSSTGTPRGAGVIAAKWSVATDASRISLLCLSVFNVATQQDVLVITGGATPTTVVSLGTFAATFPNTGLKVQDTDASNTLSIVPGSNLTADRVLTLTTGDAARTLTLTADLTADGTALSLLGRSAGTAGAMAPIAAANDGEVMRRSGTTIGFGAVDLTNTNAITGLLLPANGGTPTGCVCPYAGRTAPSGYLMCDGTAVSRTTYATLFATIVPVVGTFTVTIASPGVITLNGHGFVAGDAVYFTTTGALPTGLAANTIYYVTATSLTTNTFTVATTRGGAAINTSGTQSGTHTARACPFGLGDGSTTFNVPDMRRQVPMGAGGTSTSGPAANLGAQGGAETHTLSITEIPSHAHNYNYSTAVYSSGGAATLTLGQASGGVIASGTQGGGGAHNNVQPSLVMNYIIKT